MQRRNSGTRLESKFSFSSAFGKSRSLQPRALSPEKGSSPQPLCPKAAVCRLVLFVGARSSLHFHLLGYIFDWVPSGTYTPGSRSAPWVGWWCKHLAAVLPGWQALGSLCHSALRGSWDLAWRGLLHQLFWSPESHLPMSCSSAPLCTMQLVTDSSGAPGIFLEHWCTDFCCSFKIIFHEVPFWTSGTSPCFPFFSGRC